MQQWHVLRWDRLRAWQMMVWCAVTDGTKVRHSAHTATYPERLALNGCAPLCTHALVCRRGQRHSRAARVLAADGRAEEMVRLCESRGADDSLAMARTPSRARRPRVDAVRGGRVPVRGGGGPMRHAGGVMTVRRTELGSGRHWGMRTLDSLGPCVAEIRGNHLGCKEVLPRNAHAGRHQYSRMATWRRRSVGGTTYTHLYMDVTLPSSGTYRCVYAIHMYSVRMYSLYVPIHRVCIGMYRLYIPITCYTRQNRLGLVVAPIKNAKPARCYAVS